MCAPTQAIKIVAARAKKRIKKKERMAKKQADKFRDQRLIVARQLTTFFFQMMFNLFPSLTRSLVRKECAEEFVIFHNGHIMMTDPRNWHIREGRKKKICA